MPAVRTLVLSIASLSLFVASVGFAQNALDPRGTNNQRRAPNPNLNQRGRGSALSQGNALDASLHRGSGGVNTTIQQEDFNARNLVVTHNVAGGRGFRGSVGYVAARDFTAAAAGDSTFGFRAGSAGSAITFVNSVSTNDRFAIAQQLGQLEYRRESTPKIFRGEISEVVSQMRLDQVTARLTTARMLQQAAEPQPFVTGVDAANRRVEFSASSVQGLRSRRVEDPLDAANISTFEKARARRDVATGSLRPEDAVRSFQDPLSLADQMRTDSRIEATPIGQSTPPGQPTTTPSAYDEIVKKLVQRYATDPTVRIDADPRTVERVRKELEKVRGALGVQPTRAKGERPTTEDDELPGTVKKPVPTPAGLTAPGTVPSEPIDPEAKRLLEEAKRREQIQEAAKALRHGARVGDLTPGERARVDELVREGQKALGRGDFLRAERSFDQALTLNPDNPLLLAGLANSQLGAGLYLSSALTLRSLFAEHPEMIDVRYEANLLPNETRLRMGIETLRKRIAQGADADGYGLSLAYLGHQMANRSLVEEGLRSLTGSTENDLLRELLQDVWLGDSSSDAGQPAKPSAPPADAAPTPSEPEKP